MGRTKQPSSALPAATFFCSVPDCGETFTQMASLLRHTKIVHDDEKEDETGRTTDDDSSKYPYVCEVEGCGLGFRKRKQLYNHHYLTHNSDSGSRNSKYACPKCSATFRSPSKLKSHMKRHDDGYRCPECDFRSDTWSGVRRHKAEAHPAMHKCHVCEKVFQKPYSLKKHQRVHQKSVKCPCEDCDVELLPWRIAAHVKATHANLLPDGRQLRHMDDLTFSSAMTAAEDDKDDEPLRFECPECGKTFEKARGLRIHRLNVHDDQVVAGEMKMRRAPGFVCNVANCSKRFINHDKLQEHLNRHAGEKPFRCSEPGCVSKFASRSALQRHMKWKHLKTLQACESVTRLAEIFGGNSTMNGDIADDE